MRTLQHWNARKHLQGFANSLLTEIGEEQAHHAGEYIARRFPDACAVYSSDLKRAADTAQAIADQLKLSVTLDERLRETNLGIFQGSSWPEVADRFADSLSDFTADSRACVPGGESHASKYCRVVHALHHILHEHMHGTGPVVVVCHGGIAREVHRAATREPLLHSGKTAVKVPNACISLLAYNWQDKSACDSVVCRAAHLPEGALAYSDIVPCGLQQCAAQYTQDQHPQKEGHELTLHGREVLLPTDRIRSVPVPLTAAQWEAAAPCTPGSVEHTLPTAVPLAKCGELRIEEWGITEHLKHVT